jgi:hypothetical protein
MRVLSPSCPGPAGIGMMAGSALLRGCGSTALSCASACLWNSLRSLLGRPQLQTVLGIGCADRICSLSRGSLASAIRDADPALTLFHALRP